ncbi:hypothetical protein ES703_18172 [subsurface metagenome]
MSRVLFPMMILALGTGCAAVGTGTPKSVEDYLSKQFVETELDEETSHTYEVTSNWYNRDIAGNTANSVRMTAEYTRSTRDGWTHCRWNNVRLAAAPGYTDTFPEGAPLAYMEGFSYTLSDEIMQETFFSNFPDDVKDLLKTLIWDAPWIEVAYMSVDRLQFDEAYRDGQKPILQPTLRYYEFESKELQMGDFGMLHMRDLGLTWTGISKTNSEMCALVQYQSFSNPVESKTDAVSVRGRSCYWGSFRISLVDKQVESMTLNEDVVMELSFPGNARTRLMNMQREVLFEKRKE